MIVVVSSDWHVDARTCGFDRSGDVLDRVGDVVAESRGVGAELFLCLGDVFEGHDPDERVWTLASALRERLARLACPALLVAGNHDVVDRRGWRSAVAALESDRVHVAEAIGARIYGGLTVLCLPHVSRASVCEPPQAHVERVAAAAIAESREWGRPILAAGHYDVPGALQGGEVDMVAGEQIVMPRVVLESPDVACVVNGHVHLGQDVPRGSRGREGWDELVHIPGSLERLTFGEVGQQKGYLVLEV